MQLELCWSLTSRFIQGLYLLLITNKQSNILEDLDTLRLLSKLVPEFALSYEEEDIVKQAFELVSAFDEVISLGHKENISVMQVKQNCEMESHEEKLHKMIIQVRRMLRVVNLMHPENSNLISTDFDSSRRARSTIPRI